MNSENDDQCSLASPIESKHGSQKQSKILYTRDFLLSLTELDICKKLPSGFDPSILSEFEDSSLSVPERQRSVPERQRIPGGIQYAPNFRRGEYGSSPPTRVDILGNYSRGSNGKWDAGSSGSSDKDGELQSDRVSIAQDSGRRFGNQSRRSWQNPEHDGLLGSGAFPRPSGYTGGALGANTRGSGQSLLNKSTEPYQPPRTYKAVPHTRRDTTDFCNDETFGSVECASQDREEEERKRRASFELMRKEQQRTLKENQKQILNNRKEKIDTDMATLLENTDEEQRLWDNNSRPEDYVTTSVSQNVHGNCSLPTQAPPSRPLVPPGFKSSIVEKNLGTQSIIPTSASELPPQAGNVGFDNNVAHTKGIIITNGVENYHEKVTQTTAYMHSNKQKFDTEGAEIPATDAIEKLVIPSSGVDVSSYKTSGLQKASEGCADAVVTDFDAEKVTAHESAVSQDNPASILEKLFGNALALNDSSSPKFSEHRGAKADVDSCTDLSSQSSKFAHWFHEEAEKKPMDNPPSSEARDLLSLIVSSEKGGFEVSTVSDARSIKQITPTFPFTSNEITPKLITSASSSAMVGVPGPLYHCDKPDMSLGVLTCEDLEQVIMSEVNGSSAILQHSVQEPWSDLHTKTEQKKMDVDNSASQHLLSLLQKGTNLIEKTSSPNIDIGSSDKPGLSEIQSISGEDESIDNSEKTLTLETLFGRAFMKELQTSKAPVSVKKSSVDGMSRTDVLEPQGFPLSDDGFFHSTVNEFGSSKTSHDVSSLSLNRTQELKSVKNEGHWLSSIAPQTEGTISGTVVGLRDGIDRVVGEIQLPEEESLITVVDPIKIENSIFMPVGNTSKSEELLSSMRPVEIVDTLAALNAIRKDERSMEPGLDCSHLFRGSYNPVESELLYHHLHRQPSSQQFLHHQMNRPRPLDHHAHMTHQLNFMSPENIPHDPHRHPFPGNNFHHPFHNPGSPRLDHPAHHSMLQQMPMPGNFTPSQLLHGLPRNIQAPHFINHMASYRPELKPMQGFPLNNLQRNYGGIGVEMPGSGGTNGGNHPDALQRFLEMELRANSKQMPPVASVHNPGMIFGSEHDTGFRYR